MRWTEFVKQVADVKTKLDDVALKVMLEGSVPSWMEEPPRYLCSTEAVIDNLHYLFQYQVFQNYLPIGTDEDWGPFPLSEVNLQAWCDAKAGRFYIPPKKLIKNTWAQSHCKIEPQIISPYPGPVEASGIGPVNEEWRLIQAAMKAQGCSINAFSRAKKAYITAPNTDGSRLHFTGMYRPNGWAWEDAGFTPVDATGGHYARYSDYSHGCDVVYYKCSVNGEAMDFADVCAHPKLWVLVSDQGPFVPRFPNSKLAVLPKDAPMPAGEAPKPAYKGARFSTASGAVLQTAADASPEDVAAADLAASSGSISLPGMLAVGAMLGAGWWLLKRA